MRTLTLTMAVITLVMLGCQQEQPPQRPPRHEEIVRVIADIKARVGRTDTTASFEFNYLSENKSWIVKEYKLLTYDDFNVMLHDLALCESIYQLRALIFDISVPDPDGSLESAIAAMDIAQAHGSFLHEIVAASKLGADRIADAMDMELEFDLNCQDSYDEKFRQKALEYIKEIRTVRWVDNMTPAEISQIFTK